MPEGLETELSIRRLGPADAAVVETLASGSTPRVALLGDDRTVFVAAFDGDRPVGFAFGYVLPRRHGEEAILFVYEVDVDESFRRRGIGRRLLEQLRAEAGEIPAFVVTEPEHETANALYAALGGEPRAQTIWRFG